MSAGRKPRPRAGAPASATPLSPLGRRLLLGCAVLVSTIAVVGAFNPVPHSGGDNAGYVALAYDLVANHAYTDVFDPEGLPHTKYPPVFPALLAVLMALGARTWVALKATAVVSTVGAVALTWLWAERRVGPLPALGVAVALAMSSAVVYYSHWVLSDPLFMVLTLLALVALDRAVPRRAAAAPGSASPKAASRRAGPAGAGGERAQAVWIALGVGAAVLALFTRSAGLPLVVALLGWLALQRRARALAMSAVVIGLPSLAWWLRGRAGTTATYGQEFWMVDPYDPSLGTIGVFDLIPRALANAAAYVLRHGPGGIVGQVTPSVAVLGVLLTSLAVAGWISSVRARIGPAELFLPLYTGLILLWPEVWAGDRFALPLYPLVFGYGAVALRDLATRLPAVAGPALGAVAVLVLLVPQTHSWVTARQEATTCARVARQAGPFACYGPRIVAFVDAAAWAGRALPPGSAVLSRKPRHFFVQSGLRSRTFPFDPSADAQLDLARSLGARYVLLDQWDGQAARYVGEAVRARPGAFCFVHGAGDPATGSAQLLGIVEAAGADPPAEGDVRIASCGADFLGPDVRESYPSSSSDRIPLLEGLDS